MTTYPIATNGICRTIQGEGELMGLPMVFVRLAGCSIGCHQCDTDYSVSERLTAPEIGERVKAIRGNAEWIWVTGGEPANYQLFELSNELRLHGRIAIATSGRFGLGGTRWNFISVSPHSKPSDLLLQRGSQINLVPGLGGLRLADWSDYSFENYRSKFVTPLAGDQQSLESCLLWLDQPGHGDWRLGVQAHKVWGIP